MNEVPIRERYFLLRHNAKFLQHEIEEKIDSYTELYKGVDHYTHGVHAGRIEAYHEILGRLYRILSNPIIDDDRTDLVIVAAANRLSCGTLLVGARHWDILMHQQFKAMDLTKQILHSEVIQGFIDNKGNFHTREEAFKIAKAAGQLEGRIKTDHPNSTTLYSEDIY